MIKLLLSIAFLNLLAAMTPGPDFALIVKNTVQYSRRAGIFSALGIAAAVLIHIAYCSLGLAIIITHSPLLFNLIKFGGGSYLIYIGASALQETRKPKSNNGKKKSKHSLIPSNLTKSKIVLSDFQAFKQGFLTNLLNPKAAIFFLALFTMVVGDTSYWFNLAMAIALFITVFSWFSCLTLILSHPKIGKLLERSQIIIIRAMGIFLILFGLVLFFAKVS